MIAFLSFWLARRRHRRQAQSYAVEVERLVARRLSIMAELAGVLEEARAILGALLPRGADSGLVYVGRQVLAACEQDRDWVRGLRRAELGVAQLNDGSDANVGECLAVMVRLADATKQSCEQAAADVREVCAAYRAVASRRQVLQGLAEDELLSMVFFMPQLAQSVATESEVRAAGAAASREGLRRTMMTRAAHLNILGELPHRPALHPLTASRVKVVAQQIVANEGRRLNEQHVELSGVYAAIHEDHFGPH